MGARKSRKSKSVIRDRNRYGSRPTRTRPPLPLISVFCDDAQTAVRYFLELSRNIKDRVALQVTGNPHGASAHELIARAIAQRADQDSIWALIDVEDEAALQTAAFEAKREGERKGIQVALSKPCYELWTLLHLIDTGEAFINCATVLARVEQEWQKQFGQPFGPKAQADNPKILPQRTVAAERARQHHKNGDPSWTEVYRVIDEIERHITPRPPPPPAAK